MQKSDRADILIEVIEVFINQILYLRDAYPQQIFKKRRFYNAPVYASIFPPLNTYLLNVLKAAKELLKFKDGDVCDLKGIELVFYVDENKIVERHLFDIFDLSNTQGTVDDEFLLDFEEKVRKALYEMPARIKMMKKLPSEAKMTIRLQTTQSGHVQLSNDAHFQDFPWLQSSAQDLMEDKSKQFYILPLTAVRNLGLNVLADFC